MHSGPKQRRGQRLRTRSLTMEKSHRHRRRHHRRSQTTSLTLPMILTAQLSDHAKHICVQKLQEKPNVPQSGRRKRRSVSAVNSDRRSPPSRALAEVRAYQCRFAENLPVFFRPAKVLSLPERDL